MAHIVLNIGVFRGILAYVLDIMSYPQIHRPYYNNYL